MGLGLTHLIRLQSRVRLALQLLEDVAAHNQRAVARPVHTELWQFTEPSVGARRAQVQTTLLCALALDGLEVRLSRIRVATREAHLARPPAATLCAQDEEHFERRSIVDGTWTPEQAGDHGARIAHQLSWSRGEPPLHGGELTCRQH